MVSGSRATGFVVVVLPVVVRDGGNNDKRNCVECHAKARPTYLSLTEKAYD